MYGCMCDEIGCIAYWWVTHPHLNFFQNRTFIPLLKPKKLPADFYCIKNIVPSQSYGLSKLGPRLYLQHACEFKLRLLKNFEVLKL